MPFRRAVKILAAVGGAVLGCSGPPPDKVAAPQVQTAPADLPQSTDSSVLELHLEAPDTVAAGESIRMHLYVTNRGSRPIVLSTTAPIAEFDLVVTQSNGKPVWNYLGEYGVAQGGQFLTLAPGDSLDLTQRAWPWGQREHLPIAERKVVRRPDGGTELVRGRRVGPGIYYAYGVFKFWLGDTLPRPPVPPPHVLRTPPQPLVIVPETARSGR